MKRGIYLLLLLLVVVLTFLLSSSFPFSDDRSVDAFRNKLESATQMKAVLGADPCPNCLVIDEIDGAPGVRRKL